VLAACGGVGQGQSQAVTLRLTWQAGYDKPIGALITDFEKAYPNIHVKVEFLPIATYGQVIQTEFQAGNGPDVLYGSPGSGNTNGLGLLEKAGKLADLSSEPFAASVTRDTLLWDGKRLYGLPVAAFPIGALYNQAVFEGTGLTVPTTFSQLLNVCHTLASKGKVAIGLSGAAPNLFVAALASNYVYNQDPTWNTDRSAHKVSFATSPLWRQTLQRLVDLKSNGCFPAGVAGLQIPQAISMLASGQALMSLLPGDASASISAGNPTVRMGMFPFPGDSAASTSVPVAFGQAIGVNAASPHLKEAKQFVAFVARPTKSKILAHYMGVPTISEYKQGTLTPLLSGLAPAIKAHHTTPYAALSFPNAAVYTDLGTESQGLLTGQVSIDQALSALDRAWDTGQP